MDKDIRQHAKETYLSGYSCGEAVMKAAQDTIMPGLPPEAVKICSAFKTGIGGAKGDVCGSLLGALAAAGARDGRADNRDDASAINAEACRLYDAFREQYGAVRCDALTREFRTADGEENPDVWNSQPRKEHCSNIVGFAAGLLQREHA
ncbi:MAG: C-GCAxxG-C-C family protein [Lentisphaerae bacterium]|nr:C-GCAxxG-C-C family protein [Lentisphaerota bacterium]